MVLIEVTFYGMVLITRTLRKILGGLNS